MKPKSRDELETVIRASASDRTWTVFSENPRIIRRLEKHHGPGRKVSACGYQWDLPMNCVSFRRAIRLSEEQREARAAKLRSARKGKP